MSLQTPLRSLTSAALFVLLLVFAASACAQNIPTITTIAGGGPLDNGLATRSAVGLPTNVAADGSGNLFISDFRHSRIRKVDSAGNISTYAGTGTAGFSGDGGQATSAQIDFPAGLVADAHGNLFFADVNNNRVRKIDSSGIITTFAGNGVFGSSGDGGPATSASLGFSKPGGFGPSPFLAVDAAGNLFIGDSLNFRVRMVNTSGVISTVAGSTQGFSGDTGPATSAQLSFLGGVAVDGAGEIFIADAGNQRIRKVDTSGKINTIAGTGVSTFGGDGGPAINAALDSPVGIALDGAGNLYIADQTNQRIRKIDTTGTINTVAGIGGNGDFTGDGGAAISASLNAPFDVSVDSLGNFYISDLFNYRIRKVDTTGTISTVAGTGEANFSGDGQPALQAILDQPQGVAADAAGNVFISDARNIRVRKIEGSSTINTVVVGQNFGRSAAFDPLGMVTDSAGNLFFGVVVFSQNISTSQVQELQTNGTVATVTTLFSGASDVAVTKQGLWAIADNCIQKVTQGSTTTVAGVCGTQSRLFGGDGGPATSAFINFPNGVAVDDAGNIFIADTMDNRIRKVDTSGMINTIAGNGTPGFSGDGGPALSAMLSAPGGLRLSVGNIFFADTGNNRIRKIDPNGIITTVAGSGAAGFSGDNGPAASASLNSPAAIGIDAEGNVLVADTLNSRIRKILIPNFGIVPSPASVTIRAGQTATFTLSLTPHSGFTGSIAFACSGLPALATCSFSQSPVTPNGAQVNVTLQIHTSGPNAALVPFGSRSPASSLALWASNGLMGIAGVVLLGSRRRKANQRLLMMIGLVLLLGLLAGCGGGSGTLVPAPGPATPASTSAVQVTATSNDGTVVNVSTISLTVTP